MVLDTLARKTQRPNSYFLVEGLLGRTPWSDESVNLGCSLIEEIVFQHSSKRKKCEHCLLLWIHDSPKRAWVEAEGIIYRATLFQTSCEMQSWGSLGTETYTGVRRDKWPLYLFLCLFITNFLKSCLYVLSPFFSLSTDPPPHKQFGFGPLFFLPKNVYQGHEWPPWQ